MSRLGKAPLIAIVGVVVFATAAIATTIHGPADLASLTRAADVVLRAKVTSRETHWGAGGPSSGLIFTSVQLESIDQWKGEKTAAKIAVLVAGGDLGELSQQVVGTPVFAENEEVVVFLRKRAPATKEHLAVYEVSHWALGKFSVGSATPGSPRAMRDRSGVECIGCGPSEQDVLSLDSLRAQVKAAVQP
jgi:hypothetical protein